MVSGISITFTGSTMAAFTVVPGTVLLATVVLATVVLATVALMEATGDRLACFVGPARFEGPAFR